MRLTKIIYWHKEMLLSKSGQAGNFHAKSYNCSNMLGITDWDFWKREILGFIWTAYLNFITIKKYFWRNIHRYYSCIAIKEEEKKRNIRAHYVSFMGGQVRYAQTYNDDIACKKLHTVPIFKEELLVYAASFQNLNQLCVCRNWM